MQVDTFLQRFNFADLHIFCPKVISMGLFFVTEFLCDFVENMKDVNVGCSRIYPDIKFVKLRYFSGHFYYPVIQSDFYIIKLLFH